MRINHNLSALNTFNQYSKNLVSSSKSMEKLSSGLRINRAADDAAGLSISEKMRSQIKGLTQAVRNAQDGVSFIQTAEGALSKVSDMLVRVKELSVQVQNGTYNIADQKNIGLEMQALGTAVNDILTKTTFNSIDVFATGATITYGDTTQFVKIAEAITSKTVALKGLTDKAVDITAVAEVTATNVTDATTAVNALAATAAAAAGLADAAVADATALIPTSTLVESAAVETDVVSAAADVVSAAADVVSAAAAAGVAGTDTVVAATANVTAKAAAADAAIADVATAVSGGDIAVVAAAVKTAADAVKASSDAVTEAADAVKAAALAAPLVAHAAVVGSTAAPKDVKVIDVEDAISEINTQRAKYGAQQNQLEHVVNNLGTTGENIQAAESRVRDVDMASEMSEFTKANILVQAAQAMLAQANAQPRGVLQLLQQG